MTTLNFVHACLQMLATSFVAIFDLHVERAWACCLRVVCVVLVLRARSYFGSVLLGGQSETPTPKEGW